MEEFVRGGEGRVHQRVSNGKCTCSLSLLSARFFVSVTGHLFHQAELEYNRSFFKFAKTLPENRMVDYEFYLDRPIAKKPRAPRKSIIKSSQTAQVIREFAETNGNEKESPELK